MGRLHPVFNVALLKAYKGGIIPPPNPILLEDEAVEYEVDSILRHRRIGRRR